MTDTFYCRMGKRWLDASCALAGLIVLTPLLLIVALAVKFTSRGAIFFRQTRIGQSGRPFRIFKFRTMLETASSSSTFLTAAGDPRITRLGVWLRRTKIDELPQLINVLLGDMSLVGPRPEVPKYVSTYTDRQKRVFHVRPGITGPSINVYEEELLARQNDKEAFYLKTILPPKLEIDIAYAESVCLRNDMKLIAATFRTIFERLLGPSRKQSGRTLQTDGDNPEYNIVLKEAISLESGGGPRSMKKRADYYTRTNQMILDGCAFASAWVLAYLIRLEGWPSGSDLRQLLIWLPILPAVRLAVHWKRGIYWQIWRFVSFSDAIDIAKSIGLVSAVILCLRIFYPGYSWLASLIRIPFSVIALEGLSSLILLMSVRSLRRILYRHERKAAAASGESSKRILLYGAGRAGIMLRSELENNQAYDVIGFVDDDPRKVSSIVCDTRILGNGSDLVQLSKRYAIDEILICMATAGQETLNRVIANCQQSSVPARVIPSVRELLAGQFHNGSPSKSGLAGQDAEEADRTPGSIPVEVSAEERREKNVLVVGGAGYIGSTLVRSLLAKGYRVRVLDNLLYGDGGIHELRSRPDFELIEGDTRSVEPVVRACRDMGAVIHLGAIVGDAACALEPSRTVEINLAATKMLADICRGYGVSRLLFASTCSVYGASDHLVDEESCNNPVSLYASTKLDSESIILNAASTSFHPTVLRLATAFGTSHRLRFDLVVNLLSIKALTEKRITLHGGSQWRPFIHVHDIARCFILCMESPLDKVSNQIFNAGSDELTFTINQLGTIICNCIPGVKIEYLPGGDKRNYRVSFAKVRERLGFVCEKKIEDAVKEIKQLHEARLIGDYHDSQYSNHEFLKALHTEDIGYADSRNYPIAATLKSLSEMNEGLRKSQTA